MPQFKEHAPGTFCYAELSSTDPQASGEFYTALFGWGAETMAMGEIGTYTMWTQGGGRPAGGMMTMPPGKEDIPPHWLVYFAVADTDAAHARALELGGTSIVPPSDIPGAGRFAVIQDPVGAVFGIYLANK